MSAPEYDDIIERIMNASAPEPEPGPPEERPQDGAGETGFQPKREPEPEPETAMRAGLETAYEAKPEAAAKAETAAEAGPEEGSGQAAPGKTARARPPAYVTGALAVAVVVLAAALALQVRANRELNDRYDRAMNIWAAESLYHEGDHYASAKLVSGLTPDLFYNGADDLFEASDYEAYTVDPEERLGVLMVRLRMMGLMPEIVVPYGGQTPVDVLVDDE